MNRSLNVQQMIRRSPWSLLGLIGLTLFAAPAAAQTTVPGPSDPGMFDTVIDVPPDFDIQQLLAIIIQGATGGSDIQLNLTDGVDLGNGFFAFSGSEFNICLLYTSPSPRDRG